MRVNTARIVRSTTHSVVESNGRGRMFLVCLWCIRTGCVASLIGFLLSINSRICCSPARDVKGGKIMQIE